MDDSNTRVIVDLPAKLDGSKMGSTGTLMTLCAIVNSLTRILLILLMLKKYSF